MTNKTHDSSVTAIEAAASARTTALVVGENYVPLFPRPRDIEREPEHIRFMEDGREVVNMATSQGRSEYRHRIGLMLSRQKNRCCLEGHCPTCPGYLRLVDASFEHEHGRGAGGAKRDDRIELPDGRWVNGAAHRWCNGWKGSRYIPYNQAYNAVIEAKLRQEDKVYVCSEGLPAPSEG